MSARSILPCIAFTLTLTGCGETATPGPVTTRDSAGVRITTIDVPPAEIPEWRLGTRSVAIGGYGDGEDGGPYLESIFTGAAWLRDGRILVVDPDALRLHIYTAEGRYIRSFGGRGEGPADFGGIGVITVSAGDTIFAYDRDSRLLKVFHPDAGFIRVINVPSGPPDALPYAGWPLGRDRFVRYALRPDPLPDRAPPGGIGRRDLTAVLSLIRGDGSLVAADIEFDGGYSGILAIGGGLADIRLPFASRPLFHVGDGRVLYSSGARFELTELDADFQPRRILRWPAADSAIGPEEIRRVREMLTGDGPVTPRTELLEAMFADAVMPRWRPALGNLFMDDRGRIWASRYLPWPDFGHEDLWYVLAEDGMPLARLPLPPRSHLAAVSRDRVLLVVRDSLDVPGIGVYPVLEAAPHD